VLQHPLCQYVQILYSSRGPLNGPHSRIYEPQRRADQSARQEGVHAAMRYLGFAVPGGFREFRMLELMELRLMSFFSG
jgi:hypothetical protein